MGALHEVAPSTDDVDEHLIVFGGWVVFCQQL
jgi:hypothetical protein